jgi:hypothetical protein
MCLEMVQKNEVPGAREGYGGSWLQKSQLLPDRPRG